ncbi:TetR/AcrR family transcriptional regulator [Mycobacterium simiae]|uniref:TetR/AcrR family transcriptional regulator n=1 Tax=Mycobacterium simiae TaxID=1784 RepID=UPI00260D9BE0|nr:TetR/AcrR family transcriptional regulator [Mycobacterium simiae]
MRRHGWAGDMPRDDDEAAQRILVVARRAIDRRGAVSVSEVAESLGVTRPTIYRYFSTHEALIAAVALSAIGEFCDQLADQLGSITDPTEAVVEGIAYAFEQIAQNRYLRLVFHPGKADSSTASVTSDIAVSLGRSILERFDVDWTGSGFSDHKFDELIEVTLRTLQSLIVDPGRPPRAGADLRRFLNDWVAPYVRAQADLGR